MIDGITGDTIETPFCINDRISFSGAQGYIHDISDAPHTLMRDFPIHVIMDDGMHLHFTPEGKFLRSQTGPVIEVIGHIEPVRKLYHWVMYQPRAERWVMSTHKYSEVEALYAFDDCDHLQKIEASMVEI